MITTSSSLTRTRKIHIQINLGAIFSSSLTAVTTASTVVAAVAVVAFAVAVAVAIAIPFFCLVFGRVRDMKLTMRKKRKII